MKIELTGAIVECNSRPDGESAGGYFIRLRTFSDERDGAFYTSDTDLEVTRAEFRAALTYMEDPSPGLLRITIETIPPKETT